jgi:PAS domain S-box-containing protein
VYERVEDAGAMRKALEKGSWDLILCDYQMPKFSGLAAIALLKETGIDIPLIIVSGAIGEETAVECMRLGACDYFMKGNLPRLASAVERELKEAESRRQQNRTETERWESEERFRLLAESARDTIWTMDMNLRYTYMSPYVKQTLDFTPEEYMTIPLKEVLTPSSLELCMQLLSEELEIEKRDDKDLLRSRTVEVEHIGRNRKIVPAEIKMTFVRNAAGQATGILGYTRDITERKRAEEALKQSLEQLRRAMQTTIQVLVMAVEMKDPYTAGHQRRMTNLARTMATEMGLPPEKIEGLRMAGVIHDIGKITLPTEILSKPTKLSTIELSLIREHVQLGYDILKDVESCWPLAEIVRQHHERMDGSGYPRGLKGEEILIEARVLAVADVVEAMASHRPYRAALGLNAALEEIEKNRGLLYDGHAVDTCLRVFREKGYQIEGT